MEKLYGRQPVLEAIRAGRKIKKLLVAAGMRPAHFLQSLSQTAAEHNIPLKEIDRSQLDKMIASGEHQGVVALAEPRKLASLDELFAQAKSQFEEPFFLILDCLQDPQNFGTLIRTAEAVGIHGIIYPERRSVHITPAVVRASAGASEYLFFHQATNLARTMDELKKRGVWTIGTDSDAPTAFDEQDYEFPLALVIGSEAEGLSRLVKEKCDFLVKIPMRGQVSSLNAAVAGSIILYEAWRRRRL